MSYIKTELALNLKNFKLSEFRGEHAFLTIGLLLALDTLRDLLDAAIIVSGAEGAMIRFGDGKSQHFFGRAIDVLISAKIPPELIIAKAKEAGFTGIGYYPETASSVRGLRRWHFDIRNDRTTNDPATWGEINHTIVPLNRALIVYPVST